MTSLSPVDVARYAANAGFSGQALTNIVAIAGRESSFDPTAYNGAGLDNSVGLTQINLIGSLLPGRIQILNSLGYNVAPGDEQTAIQLLQDPQVNMDVAYALSNQGTNFSPWKMNSDPSSFLDSTDVPTAEQAVNQLYSVDPTGLGHIGESAPMGVPAPSDPSSGTGSISFNLADPGGQATSSGDGIWSEPYDIGGGHYVQKNLITGQVSSAYTAPSGSSATTYGAPYIDPTTGNYVQQDSNGRIVTVGTPRGATNSQIHYAADGSAWQYDPSTGALTEVAPPGAVGGAQATKPTIYNTSSGQAPWYMGADGIPYTVTGQAITDPSFFTKSSSPPSLHTASSGAPYYMGSDGVLYDAATGQAITNDAFFTQPAQTSYQHVTASNGALVTFDPTTGQYLDASGQPISTEQATAMAQKQPSVSYSYSIHSGGYTNINDIGPNTIAQDQANRAEQAREANQSLAQQASQFAATNAINVADARRQLADSYAANLSATDPFAFNNFLMAYGGGNISNAIHALPSGALSQAALTPAAIDQQAIDQLSGASGGSTGPAPSSTNSTPAYAFGTKGKRHRDVVPPPKPPMRSGGR